MTPFARRRALVRRSIAVLSLAALAPSARAEVKTVMFQDHMVLQRRMAVPVFGTAAAGEAVTVSFRGQAKTATAGSDGRWQVRLDAMEAGGPFEMTLKGTNTITLRNVMVGEVWLCGGQSNMEWTLDMLGGPNKDTAALADFPDIRVITMQFGRDQWKPLTPAVALHLSGTAYFFGKDLHKALGLPVGLVVSAVGGTHVERWLDPASLAADPTLHRDGSDGDLYRQWIAPVQPYGIRGAIWYQGESNADANLAPKYSHRFTSLIRGWRKVWGYDFPFYFVQLANFMSAQTDPGEVSWWAEVREAQRRALSLPHTAMAVAIDVGEAGDIHPKNKWDLGKRLALPAKHLVYARPQDSAYSGPVLDTCERKGSMVRLRFHHAHKGLAARGGVVKGFALAGPDGKWHWAAGTLRKDTVILSTTAVTDPQKVRYGWANNPDATLQNGVGLPASPFQAAVPREAPTVLAATRTATSDIPRRGRADALGRAVSAAARGSTPGPARRLFPADR